MVHAVAAHQPRISNGEKIEAHWVSPGGEGSSLELHLRQRFDAESLADVPTATLANIAATLAGELSSRVGGLPRQEAAVAAASAASLAALAAEHQPAQVKGIAAHTDTWTCTKCGKEGDGPSLFGYRRMQDGSLRSQPQCRECRRKAAKATRAAARRRRQQDPAQPLPQKAARKARKTAPKHPRPRSGTRAPNLKRGRT